ncbi:DNA-binding protein [Firmicutes bacterium AM31-12AC]|nr:DNA-binding protein [Firmicutes bacterium AM31-12AC]
MDAKSGYTINEVAYLLGVSKRTVCEWIRIGKLKAFLTLCDTGVCYVILPEELDKFYPESGRSQTQLLRNQAKRDKQQYLDYLDKRYYDLCNEIDTISKIKSYIEEVEPYI